MTQIIPLSETITTNDTHTYDAGPNKAYNPVVITTKIPSSPHIPLSYFSVLLTYRLSNGTTTSTFLQFNSPLSSLTYYPTGTTMRFEPSLFHLYIIPSQMISASYLPLQPGSIQSLTYSYPLYFTTFPLPDPPESSATLLSYEVSFYSGLDFAFSYDCDTIAIRSQNSDSISLSEQLFSFDFS